MIIDNYYPKPVASKLRAYGACMDEGVEAQLPPSNYALMILYPKALKLETLYSSIP